MPNPDLPPGFLSIPLAHRGLHDTQQGRIENAPSSVKAAVDAGYGIEIDLQPSADGVPMVFHDATLDRLTSETGQVADRTAAQLQRVTLTGSTDTIPSLAQILDIVAGKVPLLIEIKDQDGALGPNIGTLQDEVAQTLATASGPIAVMSFNPHTMAAFARSAPHVPRGLVVDAFPSEDWPTVPATRRAALAQIQDLPRIGGSFVSCNKRDLATAPLAALKAAGTPLLTWTIRSAAEAAAACAIADNITFEGYLPQHP